ncbi:MAG: hypothetical protein ACREE6_04835 [Limisphaerales bacterium]
MFKWQPALDWDSAPGKLIIQLLNVLPADRNILITIFGTAPLQMAFPGAEVSRDVDAFANEDIDAIDREHHLDSPSLQPKIHRCSGSSFQAGPNWQDRAYTVLRMNHEVRFAHPLDILVSKLHRFGERDRQAFRLIINQTGHPTEAEMLQELRHAADLYRPGFEKERQSGIWENTGELWRICFGRTIDVRAEIVRPALERRKSDYHQTRPELKDVLRDAGASPPADRESSR